MPSMADITVKNAANTDVVFVAKVPSAGDKSPARWTLDGAHAIPAFRPVLEVVTRDNGSKTARTVEGTLKVPVIQAINGVDKIVATEVWDVRGVVPTNADATQVTNGTVLQSNLWASTLIKAVMASGYAPT